MKCVDLEELISLYIDDMLDEHTKLMLEKHLADCAECKKEYEQLLSVIDLCSNLPMLELPEDYMDSLHEKLLVAENEVKESSTIFNFKNIPTKKRKKINWKVFTSIAAVLAIFVISLAGLSSIRMSKSVREESPAEFQMYGVTQESRGLTGSVPQAAPEAAMDMDMERANMDDGLNDQKNMASLEIQPTEARKVIKNAFVNLDIEGYDAKHDQIVNIITATGGYIEYSDTQYKYYNAEKPEDSLKMGSITARIPENMFIDIVNQIKSLGIVTNFGMGGQDITMQYRDTVNQVENLKIQEKKLREVMEKANNVKDILEVERELTRVRGDINNLTGNIKRWDDLVSLSTVNISLNEVIAKDRKIQPVSDNIWSKAKKGFIQSINNLVDFFEYLFVGFVSILPIVILMIIGLIPVIIYIRKRRRQ